MILGSKFIYEYNGRKLEFILLDVIDNRTAHCYLAIESKCMIKDKFDDDGNNNWIKSSLRKKLNNGFLNKYFDKNDLAPQQVNLMDSYGMCTDYITLLTREQYEKYKAIIPDFREYVYSITPYVEGAVFTYPEIAVSADSVRGVVPVCLFKSTAPIEFIVDDKTSETKPVESDDKGSGSCERTANWIRDEQDYEHCSNCNYEWDDPCYTDNNIADYCPQCGCKMKKVIKQNKYVFQITETLTREVEIIAENENEARSKLDKAYHNEEIVLDADDFCDVDFELIDAPED